MLLHGDNFRAHLAAYRSNVQGLLDATRDELAQARYEAALKVVDQIVASLPQFEIAEPTRRGLRRRDNEAAQRAADHNLGDSTARTVALHALHRLGEATTEEICNEVRAAHPGKFAANSLERRVTDLVQMGLAVKTGETRKNKSGRQADVLRLART